MSKYLKYKKKYLDLCKQIKISIDKVGGGLNNNDICAMQCELNIRIDESGNEEVVSMNAQPNSPDFLELECGHIFHFQCIFDLIDQTAINNTIMKCPICQAEIRYIYRVTPQTSNIDNIREAHREQGPTIDLMNLEQFTQTDEYLERRVPFVSERELQLSPAELELRNKTIWDRDVFSNDMAFFSIMGIDDLLENISNNQNTLRSRLLAAYAVERMQIMETRGDMNNFEQRLEELKNYLFMNDTYLATLEDPIVIDQSTLDTEAEYNRRFSAQLDHIRMNYPSLAQIINQQVEPVQPSDSTNIQSPILVDYAIRDNGRINTRSESYIRPSLPSTGMIYNDIESDLESDQESDQGSEQGDMPPPVPPRMSDIVRMIDIIRLQPPIASIPPGIPTPYTIIDGNIMQAEPMPYPI